MAKAIRNLLFPAVGVYSNEDTNALKDFFGNPEMTFGRVGEVWNCRPFFKKDGSGLEAVEFQLDTDTKELIPSQMGVKSIIFVDRREKVVKIAQDHLHVLLRRDEAAIPQQEKLWGKVINEAVSAPAYIVSVGKRATSEGVDVFLRLVEPRQLEEPEDHRVVVKVKVKHRKLDDSLTKAAKGSVATTAVAIVVEKAAAAPDIDPHASADIIEEPAAAPEQEG